MTSADMTQGVPRNKQFLDERVRLRRSQLAEAMLRCVSNTFDPTFLCLGADDADIGIAFEILQQRSLADIEATKAREQRHYRLQSQSHSDSMGMGRYPSLLVDRSNRHGGLVSGMQLEHDESDFRPFDGRSDDFDDMCDTDEAFEAEINALASICENSTLSNPAIPNVAADSSRNRAAPAENAVGAAGRSFVETIVSMGTDVTRRGGKRGVGRAIERFSFMLTAPSGHPHRR
jgi:hypothetical protein